MVVCDKCAGVQKPGGAESNAAQDWIADLRSVLSTLDGGQYLTCRAATQYRNRNYATLPQTCNAGTGCQQAIDAPACPGHRWPLWGVYTVKKLLEDPTFAADFEIRQTARVYHLDGREVWRRKVVVMRRDARGRAPGYWGRVRTVSGTTWRPRSGSGKLRRPRDATGGSGSGRPGSTV